ncbi:MAG TPA: PqqD family protein [bacterium]|nr:PqqD family protein [bacterium]
MGDTESKVDINSVYIPSENIVAREIEGEIIIIPLTSGVGDMEDELYTLNETGKVIWTGLDGKKNLKVISLELSSRFDATSDTIEKDVMGLMEELLKRKMVVKKEK